MAATSTFVTIYSADDVNHIILTAPATMPRSYSLSWPTTPGTSGYALVTDGVSALSFALLDSTPSTRTTLSVANILAMNGAPVSVVAGQTGKFLEFVGATIQYAFSVAAYGGGGNVTINWASSGAAISGTLSAANSFGNAASVTSTLLPVVLAGGLTSTYSGLGLTITNATGAFTQPGTAAGTAFIDVSYRAHSYT